MSPLPFRLKRTLGRSYKVDLDDTRRTKQALQRLGHFETPRYGLTDYPDEPLFEAIEKFQSDHDLRRDGIMRPDGETARRLGEILARTERTNRRLVRDIIYGPPINPGAMPTAFAIRGEIGEGRRNDPDDMEATRRGLAWAGYQAGDPAEPDQPVTAEEVVDTIRRFQEAEGLKADGWMRPGGETERALDADIAPKIAAAREAGDSESEDVTSEEETGDQQVAAVPLAIWGGAAALGAAGVAIGEMMRRQGKRPWSGESWPEGDPAAGSRRSGIADPLPPTPPSEPDDEEQGTKEELLPTTLQPLDLSHPIPDDLAPGIYIHPFPDEELAELGRILESRGNAKTQAEIERIRAAFMRTHERWGHIGGGIDQKTGLPKKEYHIPGPGGGEAGGKLAGKPPHQTGDGRLGGHFTDLTFISPDGRRIIHIQTVDVDKNGKVAQHELDAADRIRQHEYNKDRETYVILIPKGAQLDKIFGKKNLR